MKRGWTATMRGEDSVGITNQTTLCGSRRLGLSCHVWRIFTRAGNKGSWGIALNSAELKRRLK
jgi:hypothetical protein